MQGLPGTTFCRGPLDVVRKVVEAEGFRGLYRGFGLTALTQSPASALWWGSYAAAQHLIWRYIIHAVFTYYDLLKGCLDHHMKSLSIASLTSLF